MNTYTIDPRPESLGSGWKLAVFQDGEEVAGGVFEAGDEGYQEAVHRAEWIIEGLGEPS
jgi:hypothetical protein